MSEVKKENTVNYFILPLVGLQKSSFGVDNFITSYLDSNGYVVVNTKNEVHSLLSHENYITDYTSSDNTSMMIFAIPSEFMEDMQKYIDGKYSELSPQAKVLISKGYSSDNIICRMLNPQTKDREALAKELHVNVKLIKEIKSKPQEVNFIKIK